MNPMQNGQNHHKYAGFPNMQNFQNLNNFQNNPGFQNFQNNPNFQIMNNFQNNPNFPNYQNFQNNPNFPNNQNFQNNQNFHNMLNFPNMTNIQNFHNIPNNQNNQNFQNMNNIQNLNNMQNMQSISNMPNIPIDTSIPDYNQLWNEFKNIHIQQQIHQMNTMRLYYDYMRFCAKGKLDYRLADSYDKYFKFKFQIKTIPQNQMSQNGQNNNNDNSIYIHDQLNSLIPRPDQIDEKNQNIKTQPVNPIVSDPNVMNMTFVAYNGYRVVLVLPKNTTILQMCNMYMDKIGLPHYYIGNDIQFLYNAKMIDPFSNETIIDKFQVDVSITVFDKANVIGAAPN